MWIPVDYNVNIMCDNWNKVKEETSVQANQ